MLQIQGLIWNRELAMKPIKKIHSKTVVLPATDIDTDQIIPARFLTTTSREGLGKHLFHDWRFNSDQSVKADFVLNQKHTTDCNILVAGHNFGCGSSREHAPWALLDYGFKAVISTEIADIFRSNSLKNGLLPIIVDKTNHQWLLNNPASNVSIDVTSSLVTLENGESFNYAIDSFARYCLIEGIDQLGFLRQHEKLIKSFEDNYQWKP